MISWIKARLSSLIVLGLTLLSVLAAFFAMGRWRRSGHGSPQALSDSALSDAQRARQNQIDLEAKIAKTESEARHARDVANAEEHERKERERLKADQKAMRDRYLAEHDKLKD